MTRLGEKIPREIDSMVEHGKRTRELRLTWTSALPVCEIGEYRVIPLETSAELRQEGAVMGHCVGSHDTLCAIGTYQVFSIRDLDNHRLATMSLVLQSDGWHLDQIKGPENTELTYTQEIYYSGERTETVYEPTDLYFVAQEIVRQYRLKCPWYEGSRPVLQCESISR